MNKEVQIQSDNRMFIFWAAREKMEFLKRAYESIAEVMQFIERDLSEDSELDIKATKGKDGFTFELHLC